MATLIVPQIERTEAKLWATLGDQVAEWIEEHAVWGPGSKYGQRVTVDDEFHAWLLRAYQIFPHGHPREGRRRFDMCALELAKGTGKTERAIIVAQAEFHPTGPVRCHGWSRRGRAWVPTGGPVPYPRLVFVASSEDQVMRTAFGRFREAMKRSEHAGEYHITTEKIVLLGEDGASAGEAYPLAVSPDTADGDIPTWQHIDEPHRWDEKRHHDMFTTVVENSSKDRDADTWTMTTSTAGATGADSVEERLLHTAEAILRGELEQPGTFYMRRHCPDDDDLWPLDTLEQVEAAVREARGPAASWSGDIPKICGRYFDPKTDRAYWRRVWLNRWNRGGGRAFDPKVWASRKLERELDADEFITLGFDGARRRDATALIATSIKTGHQAALAIWERPLRASDDWEMPADEVDEAVTAAFDRYDVWRMYADPPYWDDWVTVWEGRYGGDRVHRWWTQRKTQMAHALRRYEAAMTGGHLTHDGDERFARHIANAVRKDLKQRDEHDVKLWVIAKDNGDSIDKIDSAVAGCLSWEARCDAVMKGAKPARRRKRVASF